MKAAGEFENDVEGVSNEIEILLKGDMESYYNINQKLELV